jgi:DNA-binding transcriptional MerR regulator
MSENALKVGALARRTGLSVRALHHYDEIGLLSPARRTPSGHRLYEAREVRRLQQIASLRQLGLSLDDIRDCLARQEFSLERVLALQIDRMQEEIDRRRRLCSSLERLRERLHEGEEISIEEVLRTIEGTTRAERYYTPEQLRTLARRAEGLGEERILDAQVEWRELLEDFAGAMRQGLEPDAEPVQRLASRAAALVREFTGGDAGIRASLAAMYRAEGGDTVLRRHGMHVPAGLWEYMGEARKTLDATLQVED